MMTRFNRILESASTKGLVALLLATTLIVTLVPQTALADAADELNPTDVTTQTVNRNTTDPTDTSMQADKQPSSNTVTNTESATDSFGEELVTQGESDMHDDGAYVETTESDGFAVTDEEDAADIVAMASTAFYDVDFNV